MMILPYAYQLSAKLTQPALRAARPAFKNLNDTNGVYDDFTLTEFMRINR